MPCAARIRKPRGPQAHARMNLIKPQVALFVLFRFVSETTAEIRWGWEVTRHYSPHYFAECYSPYIDNQSSWLLFGRWSEWLWQIHPALSLEKRIFLDNFHAIWPFLRHCDFRVTFRNRSWQYFFSHGSIKLMCAIPLPKFGVVLANKPLLIVQSWYIAI